MRQFLNKVIWLIRVWYLGQKLRLGVQCCVVSNQLALVKNRKNGACYFFPYNKLQSCDRRQLSNLSNGFHEHLLKKYTTPEIQILPQDVVIDCGAFVGGFAVAASKAGANKIYAIEPSPKNFSCLKLNIQMHDAQNVELLNIGLGSRFGPAILNLSKSGCDDSILEPDEGHLHKTVQIQLETIERIVDRFRIEPENLFLKIEAEGFEPEVIQGLGHVRPRVIVIDVTPERNGESPRNPICEFLFNIGYGSFINTERCLFAIR